MGTAKLGDELTERAATHLLAIPAFQTIDEPTLVDVLQRFDIHHASAGTVLIEEGAPPTGFFLVLEGRVEVTQGSGDDRLLLTVLGPGSTFGAMSFVDGLGTADATVTAAERLNYLEIDDAQFRRVLDDHPNLREALRADALTTLRANFLAHTAAFADLDASARQKLAQSIETVRAGAGDLILRQGEAGETCFLLATGAAEVLVTHPNGTTSKIADVVSGQLVGEGALLTKAPRNATVRMTRDGLLLALRREALLDAIGDSGALTTELVSLLRMRWRPRQREGVIAHQRTTADGDVITILEDRKRGRYYRLAEDGFFVWTRLDGQTTLREIAMEYVAEYGRFNPERIAQAVKGLVEAGFALAPGLTEEVEDQERPKGAGVASVKALQALSWTKAVNDVDGFFTTLDRWVGRWLFSRIGVALLAAVAIAGIVAAITEGPRSTSFLSEAGSVPLLLLALIPANAVGAVLHEAAHGLTVKRFGRRVKRAGVGWYVIAPIAFVDTSDMWLESRWRRALVSMAGPFMNLVLGGAAALFAATSDSALISALWWQAAIVSYYLAVINLNPLLEFDGYYILSDGLDRPNLRDEALRWLGTDFLKAIRSPKKLKGHWVDILYGTLALLYMLLIVFFIIVVYRALIQNFIADVVPEVVAAAFAWALAGGLALLMLLALSAQMRGLKAPSH